MNDKTPEMEEQRVADLLKQNFHGLDPWIPARPPLGSVVPKYEEAHGVGTYRISFMGERRTGMGTRAPRLAFALLAAAVIVAVGFATGPYFLRGTGPAASGLPSAEPTGSTSVVATPTPLVSTPTAGARMPTKLDVVISDGNLNNVRSWSPDGRYLAVDQFWQGGCTETADCGPEMFGFILDRNGQQVERLAGTDGWRHDWTVGWLDDTTYVVREHKGDAVRYVWAHVGARDAKPITGIDKPCAQAVAGLGGLFLPVGAECDTYVQWTPAGGVTRAQNGHPTFMSRDGTRVSIDSGPVTQLTPGAEYTLTILDTSTGRALFADSHAIIPNYPGSAAFSPDGRNFAYVRSDDGSASYPAIVDLTSGVVTDVAADPLPAKWAIWVLSWAGNDKLVVQGGTTADAPEFRAPEEYAYGLDGKRLPDRLAVGTWLTVASNGTIAASGMAQKLTLTAATGEPTLAFDVDVEFLAWSPDGTILAVTDGGGRLLFIR